MLSVSDISGVANKGLTMFPSESHKIIMHIYTAYSEVISGVVYKNNMLR